MIARKFFFLINIFKTSNKTEIFYHICWEKNPTDNVEVQNIYKNYCIKYDQWASVLFFFL